MKRCPQCNSVFNDNLDFCTNDGTPLIGEKFGLPSESLPVNDDEEITIIHQEPITIDIPGQQTSTPPEQFGYQAPPTETVVPVVIEDRRSGRKNWLFLIAGILLGGAVVLAAVLLGMFLYQNRTKPAANTANRNAPANSTPTAKNSPTATPLTASAKHEKRTDAPDDEFNGRVITLNAFVRASPDRTARQMDILPIDDRLNIDERENEGSPWYHVTCEHGTSGWMHGNTIEFTR